MLLFGQPSYLGRVQVFPLILFVSVHMIAGWWHNPPCEEAAHTQLPSVAFLRTSHESIRKKGTSFTWHFHQTCRVGLFIWIVKFSLIKSLESGLVVTGSCSWSIKKHLCLEIIRDLRWTCFMVLRRLSGSRRQMMVYVGVSGPDKDIVPDLKLPHGDKSLVFLVCQRIGVGKIYQNHYSILS